MIFKHFVVYDLHKSWSKEKLIYLHTFLIHIDWRGFCVCIYTRKMESTIWIAIHSCLSYSHINFMANFVSNHLIGIARCVCVCVSVYVTRVFRWCGYCCCSCMSLISFSNDFETIQELANWVWAGHKTKRNIHILDVNNLWKWNMQIHSKRSLWNIVDVVLNVW